MKSLISKLLSFSLNQTFSIIIYFSIDILNKFSNYLHFLRILSKPIAKFTVLKEIVKV